jgi:DNA modification methylase
MEINKLQTIKLNNIYEIDCLDGMKLLDDKSIDLIIIDPPYNIRKDDWDCIDNYDDWMFRIFKECERVLKATGSFYWFHNDFEKICDFQYFLKNNTAFIFRNILIWNKKFKGCNFEYYMDNAIATNKNRTYRKFVEYCLFYTFKDITDLSYSNIQLEIYEPIKMYFKNILFNSGYDWNSNTIAKLFFDNGMGKKLSVSKQMAQIRLNYNYNQFRLMGEKEYNFLLPLLHFDKSYLELKEWWNILNNKYLETRKKYKKETFEKLRSIRYTFNKQKHHSVVEYQTPKDEEHPTRKPLDMIIDIVKTSSNENDVVLDCFMGTGTTAKACIKTNRKYIGFENEPKYISLANREIKNMTE